MSDKLETILGVLAMLMLVVAVVCASGYAVIIWLKIIEQYF